MRCQDVLPRLSEFNDGDLSLPELEALREHLGQCPSCRRELEGMRSLIASARRLSNEVDLPRDLWPDIERRLSIRPWSGRAHFLSGSFDLGWLRLVAAAVLLLALSLPMALRWAESRAQLAAQPSTVEDAGAERLAGFSQQARSADGVLAARRDLLTLLERHRDVVDAQTIQVLEENILLLDRAIGELSSALNEDPRNRNLRLLLAARYQQEMRLLQKVTRV